MTVKEAFKQALAEEDLPRLGRVVDQCRFRLGMIHRDLCHWAEECGVSAADFDALLYEVDSREGQEG